MEWLNDKAEQINKPLTSDSAEETERLVERVESVISQLEKKKKVRIAISTASLVCRSIDQLLLFASMKSYQIVYFRVFLGHYNKREG